MKIKLLEATSSDLMYVGARTCYNTGSPIELWESINAVNDEEKVKLLKGCLRSNHTSVLEHSLFTFAIEGVSRALLAQLTRHRVGVSFSVQSQRYVEIKEDKNTLIAILERNNRHEIDAIADKYFVITDQIDAQMCLKSLIQYRTLIEDEHRKAEDARMVLPNATKTNIVMSCNLRSLIHLCNERLCVRAQKEIRLLVQAMAKLVIEQYSWLEPYLKAKCEKLRYCPEVKSCGRFISGK